MQSDSKRWAFYEIPGRVFCIFYHIAIIILALKPTGPEQYLQSRTCMGPSSSGGKGGGKRGIRLGRHCAGDGIWRGKNMEF